MVTRAKPKEAAKLYVSLTDKCVKIIHRLSPVKAEILRTRVGDLWQCSVSEEDYEWMNKHRRPGESWSEMFLRLIAESRRLDKVSGRVVKAKLL